MNNKSKSIGFLALGLLVGMFLMYIFNNYKIEKKTAPYTQATITTKGVHPSDTENAFEENSIENLTNETVIINYVKANHKLPDFYITKAEARQQGWNPSRGNLCDVLPGKAIGGDKFTNRERQLPKGEQYFEADVNYNCGNRGADRIVFTKNGDVWLTHNHYKTFQKQ